MADASICRDKSFIPSISLLWDDKTDLFEVVENYLEGLSASRDVTVGESKVINPNSWRIENTSAISIG